MIKLTKLSTAFLILIVSTLLFSSFLWFVLILSPSKAANLAIQISETLNNQVLSSLPSNLELQLSNGQLRLNQPSPTCFFKGLIYDAQAKPDASLLKLPVYPGTLCQPKMILGTTFFMLKDKDSTTKTYEIPRDFSLSLTASQIQQYIHTFVPKALPLFTTMYYLVPTIIFLPLIFFFLLSSLLYAFILSLAQKIFHLHPELNFSHNYAFSLSIFCLLNLAFLLLESVNIHLSFPFLNTVLILVSYFILPANKVQSQPDSGPIPLSGRKSGQKKSSL